MGSGASKKHETFAVSPAGLAADNPLSVDGAGATTVAALDHTLELIAGLPSQTDGPFQYEDLVWLVNQATEELHGAQLSESDAELYRKKIAADAAAALQCLDTATLHAWAADQGFQYPQLVGLSGGDHPLAHWLNPAYPAASSSKAKVQAKAIERFELLASGAVSDINGVTLADLPAGVSTPDDDSWNAAPAEVALAVAAVADAVTKLKYEKGTDGGLSAMLSAERHLHTAVCEEMGADLAITQAAGSALVTKQLDTLNAWQRTEMVDAAVGAALESGVMPERQAFWLHPTEQLALLRANTAPAVRDQLEAKAQDRANTVRALAAAIAVSDAAGDLPASVAALPDWVAAKQQAIEAAVASSWKGEVAARGQQRLNQIGYPAALGMRHSLTSKWRTWAKGQPIADLRKAAVELGMSDVGAATRAQVQNYIAGQWDPGVDQAQIQTAVTALAATKKQQTAMPSKGKGKASVVAQEHGSQPTPTVQLAPPIDSWAGKHAQLVAALQVHANLSSEIPTARPASEIAKLTLGKAQPASVGGMHQKNFHEDGHGGLWLHKPDSTKGARAHAEAAAARLHNLAGVRTPPVYVRAVEGKLGSLQPWLAGAEPLGQTPGAWSQTDVDAIVRFHVAAWACGNHDGNPNNIVRTPSGGLAPIDHGQAWRYFGADRLALDYDPNGKYGNPPPAYLIAYRAALEGQLAKGVRVRPEAALPIIKAFEQMPDSVLRSELQSYAIAGVKANLPWVERVRKGAQKRLGVMTVSADDIAEQFLLGAVARKASLRANFAQFFSAAGFDNKALTKVA